MDGHKVPYIFDSNCFIEGWHRTYSPDIMPDYWELLSADIKAGGIIFPRQVKEEINEKDDDLKEWLEKHKSTLTLAQENKQQIEDIVRDVVDKYPKILKRRGVMEADPYVIALANLRNGTVVTTERDGGQKIPAVCKKLNIKCINPMQHIKERGWKFVKK